MPETQPEPLSAILAEMRKAVVPMICGRPKIEAVSIRDVLQWVDRIEEAVKLELSKNRPNNGSKIGQFGNAAAMRAALERALKWWTEKGNILEREAVFKQIRAAISAPARNCDRFATAVGAMEEWGKYPQSRYKGCRVCPHGDTSMVSPLHLTLAEWLFATAKGGAE